MEVTAQLDLAQATELVRRHVGADLSVTSARRLHGGMIYRVWELALSGPPGLLVCKAHAGADHQPLHEEYEALRWYRAHTSFPVPQPHACVSDRLGTCLLMERAAGTNLEAARLAPAGRDAVRDQLVAHVTALHRCRRTTYGSALRDDHQQRWLDRFAPMFADVFTHVRDRLSARTRWITEELLKNLDQWLPEGGEPTMIHGDLWQTNIIVDDARPDEPVVTAFIDVGAVFSDVELELSYLRLFRTADAAFMERYTQAHPLRAGFARRCRVYWLYFMLQHVRLFGTTYLKNCEGLARQIERMAK